MIFKNRQQKAIERAKQRKQEKAKSQKSMVYTESHGLYNWNDQNIDTTKKGM